MNDNTFSIRCNNCKRVMLIPNSNLGLMTVDVRRSRVFLMKKKTISIRILCNNCGNTVLQQTTVKRQGFV